jgi:hypothetical protein
MGRNKAEKQVERPVEAAISADSPAPDQKPERDKDPFRVPGHPEARVPGRIGPQTPDRVMANRECRDC